MSRNSKESRRRHYLKYREIIILKSQEYRKKYLLKLIEQGICLKCKNQMIDNVCKNCFEKKENRKQHKKEYLKKYFSDPEHKHKQRESAKKCMRKKRAERKELLHKSDSRTVK